jgi:hypothetical protein
MDHPNASEPPTLSVDEVELRFETDRSAGPGCLAKVPVPVDLCLSGRSRPSRHQKLLTATNTSFRRTTFYLILSISITRRWTPFSVFSTALRSRRVYVSTCICGTRGLHAFSSWSAQSDPHWLTTLGSSLTALRCLADGSTSIKYSWSASPSSHLRSFMICRSTA